MRALLFALLLLALPAAAQTAPKVEVGLGPHDRLTVGDRVDALLTLRVDPATLSGEPRFPVWGTSWGGADVLEKESPQRIEERGSTVWRQRLVLAAFRTGKVDLPPVEVAVPLRDRTIQARTPAGLALTVRSVLPAGEENPAPKPPAPPRQLPIGAAFWWTLSASGLALALLGWMLWRRRRAEGPVEAARPQLAPFEELLGELDRIAAEPSVLRLHTRLSLALRAYLGRSLGFAAAESTTSEIHRLLLARRMPGPLVRQLVELLRACDLVKFARQDVGEERARERLATARQLARETETWARPVEPVDLSAAGPERREAVG
ncbi:MAG TPA: hypothetical protein VKM72_30915 [Thermoanaerobaculia bacterium]|nr:hypothetical protein [Thermoanaerobaculia bacterium]